MKKCIVIIFLCSICLLGCKIDIKTCVLESCSEIRSVVFEAKTNDFRVSYTSGERENPYYYDGKSQPRCDFGIITLYFSALQAYIKVPFEIDIDGRVSNGYLEKNPFNECYMLDLETKVQDSSRIKIKIDEFEYVELQNLSSNWEIDYSEAIDVGIKELKSDFESLRVKNKLNCECYIKPITEESYSGSAYFWSFSFINQKLEKKYVVFDVNSGEMLVKNKTI